MTKTIRNHRSRLMGIDQREKILTLSGLRHLITIIFWKSVNCSAQGEGNGARCGSLLS